MHARILLVVASTAIAAVVLSGTAVAAPTDVSLASFDVQAGTLDITAPASADLGGGAPGDSISGSLGGVTVTDSRAGLDASWVATVTSTDFTTGAATVAETVSATSVDYRSESAIATTGDGTFTEGQPDAASVRPLDNVTPTTAFTHTGGSGNNSATWNPTLSVHVPPAKVAGTYTGTVTHSVA